MEEAVIRIIDANLNRALEGLRVCEEILRFYISTRNPTRRLKDLRHRIVSSTRKLNIPYRMLLESRDSLGDVGRLTSTGETKREGLSDIFIANLQRTKESLRVLEEFSKLINAEASWGFKEARYSLYTIEKNVLLRYSSQLR